MATSRDVQPVTPITDAARMDQLDRIVYEVDREKTPLLTLVTHVPSTNYMYKFTEKKRRLMGTTVNTAVRSSAEVIWSMADTNFCEEGDILKIASEVVMVQSVGATRTVTVVRARQGTTAYAGEYASGTSIFLIGNARYFGDSISLGLQQKKAVVTGYMQRFTLMADANFAELEELQPMVPGAANPWDEIQVETLADIKQLMETALVNNVAAVAPSATITAPGYTIGLAGRLTSALGASVTTLDSDGELTREIFNETMQKITVAGAPRGPIYAFCGKIAYQAPAQWIKDMQRVPGLNPMGTVGAKSNTYQPPMGAAVTLVHEPALDVFAADKMYILDMSKVKLRVGGKGRQWISWYDVAQERKTKKAGFYRGLVGLQLECPWAHGYIENIKEVV